MFFSCKTNEKEIIAAKENVKVVKIEYKEPDTVTKVVSSKDVEYITLETTEESLLGTINELLILNDMIFVLDKKNGKGIFVFDKDGKFQYKIQHLGSGKGKYLKITDFKYNRTTNQIEIYDDAQQKVIIYSVKGEFIKEINNTINFYTFFPVSKNQRLYYASFFKNKSKTRFEKHYRLYKVNESGKVVYNFLSFDDEHAYQKILSLPQNFYQAENSNTILFYEAYNNNIYELKKDSIAVKYKLDFSDLTIPEGFATSDIKDKSAYVKKNKFSHLHKILFDDPEELVFDYVKDNYMVEYGYNKESKKSYSINSYFVEDDGVYFRPSICMTKTAAYSIIEPSEILRYDNETLSSRIKDVFGSLKEISNPVIIKVKR